MTCPYEAFSAVLTCWGQALLLEALLKAEENNDLRFSPQKRTPVDWGLVVLNQCSLLREIPLFIIFTGCF